MVSVNGYFDGTACVAVDTSQFHPNQRLVITALDEDFTDCKLIEGNVKKLAEMKKKSEAFRMRKQRIFETAA
ncbi:MAG: hypothetical protein IKP60_10450 [Treponema sp.]|nr:hypothetical protein [Treponema sp.]